MYQRAPQTDLQRAIWAAKQGQPQASENFLRSAVGMQPQNMPTPQPAPTGFAGIPESPMLEQHRQRAAAGQGGYGGWRQPTGYGLWGQAPTPQQPQQAGGTFK